MIDAVVFESQEESLVEREDELERRMATRNLLHTSDSNARRKHSR